MAADYWRSGGPLPITQGHGEAHPAGQSDLERAAVAFLRRRGFVVSDPGWALKAEANGAAARAQRAMAAFGRLMDWVAHASAAVRGELLALTLPLFAHLFFWLVEQSEPLKAREFLAVHVEVFTLGRLGSKVTRIFEQLRTVRLPADLLVVDMYAQFRQEERSAVASSDLARDLMMSRLLSADMVMLADIFQRRVTVVPPQDGSQTGALAPEPADVELRALNPERLPPGLLAADAIAPLMAYGIGWAPPEGGLAEPGVTSASNFEVCKLPLPRPGARARVSASKHFAELLARRDPVGAGKLPSVAAYVSTGDGGDTAFSDVNAAALSSDGRFCAMASARGCRLWDLASSGLGGGGGTASDDSGARRAASGGAADRLRDGGCDGGDDFFHDARAGASGGSRGQKRKAFELSGGGTPSDRKAGAYRCTTLCQWARVLSADFSLDGSLLLTGGQDGAVRLWNVRKRKGMGVYAPGGGDQPVWALGWCPGDHYFISSGADGEGLLWTLERASPLRAFGPHPGLAGGAGGGAPGAWPDVEVVKAHPCGHLAALGGEGGAVLWDVAVPSAIRALPCGSGRGATALACSPDGSLAAVGLSDGGLQLWDLVAGRLRTELRGAHRGSVTALDFSWPSAEAQAVEPLLFSGGEDGAVHLRRIDAALEDDMQLLAGLPLQQSASSAAVVGGRFTIANLLLVAGAASAAA